MSDAEILGLLDSDSPDCCPANPVEARPGTVRDRSGFAGRRPSRSVHRDRRLHFVPATAPRAATRNLSLEERVGLAIGVETKAREANDAASVCVNLLRHPPRGRLCPARRPGPTDEDAVPDGRPALSPLRAVFLRSLGKDWRGWRGHLDADGQLVVPPKNGAEQPPLLPPQRRERLAVPQH